MLINDKMEENATIGEGLDASVSSMDSEVNPNAPLSTYPGSGEHKTPPRMLKIDEIVKWDMDFGVTIGPAGYDHRLRCPYCNGRLLLNFYEGGRDFTGIRIAYECRNCSSYSIVTFTPPGYKPEIPEVAYGERIIVIPAPEEPPQEESVQETSTPPQPSKRGGQRNQRKRKNERRQATDTATSPPSTTTATAATAQPSKAVQGSSGSGRQQQSAPRSNQPPATGQSQQSRAATAKDDIALISEVVQEQADRSISRAPSQQRRRRRPYRPS